MGIFSKLFGGNNNGPTEFEKVAKYCEGNQAMPFNDTNWGDNDIYIGNYIIAGSNGTGKTGFINKLLEKQDSNLPIIAFDGNGSKNKNSIYSYLKDYSKANKKEFIVVDLVDTFNSDRYNPFKNANDNYIKNMISILLDNTPELKANEFKMKRIISYVIKCLKDSNLDINLEMIAKYTDINNLSALLSSRGENLLSDNFVTDNLENFSNLNYILQELEERAEGIIEGNLNIKDVIAKNSVILFLLDNSDKEFSETILKFALTDIKNSMDMYQEKKKICIFDEVTSETSGNILDLLKKSNNSNINSIITCQSIRGLEYSSNMEQALNQIIENISNYIVFRQNSDENAVFWANIIGKKNTIVTSFSLDHNSKKMLFEQGQTKGGFDDNMHCGDRLNINYEEKYIYNPEAFKTLKQGECIYYYKANNKYGKQKLF